MNAPDKAIEIKAVVTGAIAFVTALIGPIGWIVIVWIIAMLLDYLTGTWAALSKGEWASSVARQGLWHKLGSIVAVLISALLDVSLGVIIPQLGINYEYIILTPIVCMWYILTELGSMIENIDKLGAPVPDFLRDMIKKVRNKVDSIGEENTEHKNE